MLQAEVCVGGGAWEREFHIHGGRVCNTLMDGSGADRTPLHEAALHGRLLPLNTLISQGLSVCVKTLDGVTPLHEACLGGHVIFAKILLQHGADVNAVSIDGATPLFYACYSGSSALVSLILAQGAAHQPAHLLNAPLHEAAKRGHTACVEVLLARGVDADVELADLGTALYLAAQNQRTACVHTLLISGADVQRGRGLDTPLHAAARVGGAREVELLLEHGADRKCKNSEGKRAVDYTAANSTERLLLQKAGVCDLSQLCRLRIRRSLGQMPLNKISTLYLPHTLHNYLLYQ